MQRVIDSLAGKKLGLQGTLDDLADDPCETSAYRLAGPLEAIACAIHLSRGYRLAFTILDRAEIYVLWIGPKEPELGANAPRFWQFLHELFGEGLGIGRPRGKRIPCCEDGMPTIDEERLADFEATLTRAMRRRRRGGRGTAQRRRRR